jgi:hypothetical protein
VNRLKRPIFDQCPDCGVAEPAELFGRSHGHSERLRDMRFVVRKARARYAHHASPRALTDQRGDGDGASRVPDFPDFPLVRKLEI